MSKFNHVPFFIIQNKYMSKFNHVPTERCAIDTDKFFNSSRNEEDNYPLYTIHECVYRVPSPVFQHTFPSEMEPWFFKDW